MSDMVVYRSTHPEVLAARKKVLQRRQEIGDRWRTLLDELGFPDRTIRDAGREVDR